MTESTDLENLPGYKKKSFTLPYNGGEIWFEHLDGMYDYEKLVLKKLEADICFFTRPSSTSYICFAFHETTVTDRIYNAVSDAILKNNKRFMKIAMSGLDKRNKNRFRHELTGKGFAIGFVDGLEDAKMWLLP